ncbi:unnamed protein product [Adineta ricciae]|uniref:Uncharacterized protein n=1 Tax=Adineta ricciae TaxID=249248 RepID=A0A813UW90_ADIRI|nr:unnamed protein product [Adineta ricciae]CAF1445910.1 unnamed protein product [Adineta ricciae]
MNYAICTKIDISPDAKTYRHSFDTSSTSKPECDASLDKNVLILLPNVPLIDLPRFRDSIIWSWNKQYNLPSYFTSKSYMIDALNISSRTPKSIYHHRSCAIYRDSSDHEVNVKRMNRLIFNKHFQVFDNHRRCKKQYIHKIDQRRQQHSIPIIHQHSSAPPKHVPTINHIHTSVASPVTRLLPTLPAKSHFPSPIDIASHTRFGKSILALYFQKHRFISPNVNNKKDQFLWLLAASIDQTGKKCM